jgi:hypothetical protein
MKTKYEYDVAISFAEEDRNVALALALALEMSGIHKVYYYPLRYEATWGKQIEKRLQRIYSKHAMYAVVLLSDWYFKKHFARIEREAILERVRHAGDTAYMLPVILNNFPVKKQPEFATFGYLRWDYNPKEIAVTLSKVLGKNTDEVRSTKTDAPVETIRFTSVKFKSKHAHIGDKGKVSPTRKPKRTEVTDSEFETETLHIGNSDAE